MYRRKFSSIGVGLIITSLWAANQVQCQTDFASGSVQVIVQRILGALIHYYNFWHDNKNKALFPVLPENSALRPKKS